MLRKVLIRILTVQEIERAIDVLTPERLDELYLWLDHNQPHPIDARIQSDLDMGRSAKAIHRLLDDEKSSGSTRCGAECTIVLPRIFGNDTARMFEGPGLRAGRLFHQEIGSAVNDFEGREIVYSRCTKLPD